MSDARATQQSEQSPQGDESLTTSPLFFGYTGRDGRLAAWEAHSGARFRLSSPRAAEMLLSFLEPHSEDPACSPASSEDLAAARAAGLLISTEESERVSIWERRGWSRPAYLMLTQMDLPYLESPGAEEQLEDVRARRRAAIEEYESVESYPEPTLLSDGPGLPLPTPSSVCPSLSALSTRRSVRAFAGAPDAGQLSNILHSATSALRLLAEDRRAPDRLRVLNSFFSWAHVFVLVQRVEGLPEGVFEYDWEAHRLLHAAPSPSERELLACVQGQRWALGGGFIVFVVADLRSYAWIYRHSRAYMHLLMQVGELGQELLMAATELGLGGWTTPALHESHTAALLGLPAGGAFEALSMVKLGRPASARSR